MTNVTGNLTNVWGDLTGVSGNLTGVSGDLTGVTGNLSDCGITVEDRAAGCGQKSKVQERKDRLNRARYVLLAQAQQDTRDRQNRDGQHQGATEALEGVDDFHAKLS